MIIREAKSEDAQAVSLLMEELIDEIYTKEDKKVRESLKANFTNEGLMSFYGDKQTILYVVEVEGQIVSFLFGWLFLRVFTMYWLFCKREFRGKGTIRFLLVEAEKKLRKLGCQKIEMYAYANHNKFLGFCEKLGFSKGILIERSMFGFKIQNIYKYLTDPQKIKREVRLKIMGIAGQGVKLLSYTLASILSQLGNEVTLNLEYDSAVRSGNISADLIYSHEPIENPIIDTADILIKFTKSTDAFPARSLIIDESIEDTQQIKYEINVKDGVAYGLEDVALSRFGSKIYINMIALGRILRHIGINILLINIEDILPSRAIEKNIKAIKFGFNYTDDI